MYTVHLLTNDEFDNLPYKYAKTSIGAADKKTGKAYIRRTGINALDLITIDHEINELVNKFSEHEFEGIRYKGKTPSYNPPPPPRYPTAEEIFGRGKAFGQTNYPLAYGAREKAIADLLSGNQYYQQFQPTSFEEALGNQYFKNVWPDTESKIRHALSLSGMEYSPVLADVTGKEYGRLSTDIGEYLSNLANERAKYSLERRLGIDPFTTYEPYAETDVNQTNAQVQADYNYAVQKAQQDFQNALAKAKQKAAKSSIFGTFGGAGLGAGLGALFAAPTGGMSLLAGLGYGALGGATAGGMASPLWGGGEAPLDFGSALQIASMFPGQSNTGQVQSVFRGGKGGTNTGYQATPWGQAPTWSPYVDSTDFLKQYNLFS